MGVEPEEIGRFRRRHARERAARKEAESIAERVTAELYATAKELERLNTELGRTNEELQAVNRSMRDFVAIASHDLRGPLTSILGYTAMLQDHRGRLDEEQISDFLGVIARQGHHLNRLVEDLLTVSRIEAGALDVHLEVVRLGDALREGIHDFMQHADGVRVIAPDGLAARCDPEHLQRILTNFVTNALKYGAPPVEIEACEAGDWVEIRVRDNGEGVPEDFLPRLFGRFARADSEATRNAKGTGLGLSIVQGLARANGGDTWYEPNSPNGSCFAVRLPRVAA